MTHTTHHTDFDPSTPEVELHAHWHHLIDTWECKDEEGHTQSLQGAETEVAVKHIDEPDYRVVATATWPANDVQVPATKDGYYEVKQRQRTKGGQWADWTKPKGIKVDLQPPRRPQKPDFEIGESDGVTTKVHAFMRYPDRDVQGNTIEPAQMLLEVLRPCGSSATDWEKVATLDYPDERVTFDVPVGDGVLSYQGRVIATNMCRIESEPSEVATFDIQSTRLASSGEHSVRRGCL